MEYSQLQLKVIAKIGKEAESKLHKSIVKNASSFADGYELGKLYEIKAKDILTPKNK